MFRPLQKQVLNIIKNGSNTVLQARFASEAAKTATTDTVVPQATITIPVEDAKSPITSTASMSATSTNASVSTKTNVNSSSDLLMKIDNVANQIVEPEALRKSMTFDEVPGPVALRHFAKFWSFVPIMGTQVTASAIQYMLSAGKIFGSQLSWGNNLWLFRWLLDEYGPVVRLHGPFGGDVVILSRPEHASSVFQNEGRYPVRSSLDCVEKYRLQHRQYKQAGPFLMYGPEWEKLRATLKEPLQHSVINQYDKIDQACDELISRILRIRNKQEEVTESFNTEIYKWSMECLCSVTLDKHLGFLDLVGLSSTSEPARLLDGLEGATKAIRRCETGLHMWKFIETPAWKSLVEHCESLDGILYKYIRNAQDTLRKKKEDDNTVVVSSVNASLLETLLLKDGMMPDDVLTVILDMMLIGVNAVSHGVAFLMYHLARYQRAQRLLYEEIQKQPDKLSNEKLTSMPYLKACIKESLRLKPPIPILTRVLSKDILVHNYRVPKGTYMLIATHLSSLREEYFEDALKFKPERWLNPENITTMQTFAFLPFGHGAKGCIARELAELQISLLIVKILRKFRLEYHYGDINTTNRLLATPDRALKFRFVDRNG